MNGENVSMKPCNRLQDNRQKPRFIVHLDNKGDRLSPCLFMKWKNIIFVFVERTSAVSNGDIVVALIDDSATVKRFYKEDGHIRLQPENDNMDPIIVPDCEILGRVHSLYRPHVV